MESVLIKTKLLVPKPRQRLVSRPALLERLGAGLAGKAYFNFCFFRIRQNDPASRVACRAGTGLSFGLGLAR